MILAADLSSQGVPATPAPSKAEHVARLIGALNTDTDLVLVALGSDAESVAPSVWALAAYVVELGPEANEAEALRASLRAVLNRGRDTALVVAYNDASVDASRGGQELTAATVHRMVAAYCAASGEMWAVAPEGESGSGYPVLLGRKMIELFLRGHWQTARELLSAHREHVLPLVAAAAGRTDGSPGN